MTYRLLKKSICRARLFTSRLLKQFMDWASTSSCNRLFLLGKEVQTCITATMLLHQTGTDKSYYYSTILPLFICYLHLRTAFVDYCPDDRFF